MDNAHHSSEILTNDSGYIQNKVLSNDQENSVQLVGNREQFSYGYFVRSRFQLNISSRSSKQDSSLGIKEI